MSFKRQECNWYKSWFCRGTEGKPGVKQDETS